MAKRAVFLSLQVLLLLGAGTTDAAAGSYGGRIVMGPMAYNPTSKLNLSVRDLQRYLLQMTGATYEIRFEPASSAINLMLTTSLGAPPVAVRQLAGRGLDAFVINADARKLTITANNEQGLANGIYFYLEEIGVRWLLPGRIWTDVPLRKDVTLRMDRLIVPSFKVRSYAGTGGFYSYEWGRSYTGSASFETVTTDWQRRLRYGGDYALGKAVGEAFIADRSITPILARHPHYLAIIKGQPSPLYLTQNGKSELNITAKLNAGNPAAVDLFCDWTLRNLRTARASPDKSLHDVVSVEPSDGYGYGDDTALLPGNGSGSDQSFFIANACARKVRAAVPGASVILLAYAGHAAPPSFDLEPNVIVQVTPYAFQDTDPSRFIAAWAKKAPRLTVYDYWSIPDWTHDEPSFDYTTLASRLRDWRSNKIEGANAESTYGAGAMGLGHYIAAHLMWDLNLNEGALTEDWFERAFGPAKVPMRRMMDRWAHSFRLTSSELGLTYNDLQAAARLAQGQPSFVARIDDFIRYVHYLRLRLEIENELDPVQQSRKAVALAEYLLDVDETRMVHTTRIIDLYARRYPAISREFDTARLGSSLGGWARIRQLSHDDVARLLIDGTRTYPLPDFEIKDYSNKLAFVRLVPPSGETALAWGTVMPTIGPLEVDVQMPPGVEVLPLRCRVRSTTKSRSWTSEAKSSRT